MLLCFFGVGKNGLRLIFRTSVFFGYDVLGFLGVDSC